MAQQIDLAAVGGILGAIGGVVGGLWGWMQRNRRNAAEVNSDVAQSKAEESIYRMMTERLTALETDVGRLRDELAQERSHSRALERHIFKLESLMRRAGLEPPVFTDIHSSLPRDHL